MINLACRWTPFYTIPNFQQIEATWRALHFLLENIEADRGVLVHFLHFSKEELWEDLEYAADITCSEWFRHLYSADFGQFGGTALYAADLPTGAFFEGAAEGDHWRVEGTHPSGKRTQ